MTNIWELLGIEATGDLKAIKKAYAARLKRTRPDDDADAYQTLRQAYEAALAQARWIGASEQANAPRADTAAFIQAPAEPWQAVMRFTGNAFPLVNGSAGQDTTASDEKPPEPELPPPPAWRAPHELTGFTGDAFSSVNGSAGQDASASDEKPPEPEPELPPPPAWRAPHELASWFVERLQAGDADGTALERELDALPLSLQTEASRCFADVVLAHDVPVSIEDAVLHRFGWLSDFRAADSLGALRIQALREHFDNPYRIRSRWNSTAQRMQTLRVHFDDRREAFIPYPDLLDRYRLVTAFAQDAQRLEGWRQWLYIALASTRIRRLWNELQPNQRHAIGVDVDIHDRIHGELDSLLWARLALLAAFGASVIGWKEGAESFSWPVRVLAIPAFLAMGLGGVWFVHLVAIGIKQIFLNTFFRAGGGAMRMGIPVRTLAATACLTIALGGVAIVEDRARYLGYLPFALIGCGLFFLLWLLLAQWRRANAQAAPPWSLLLLALLGASYFDMKSSAATSVQWFVLDVLSPYFFFVILAIGSLLALSFLLAQWRDDTQAAWPWVLLFCILSGAGALGPEDMAWTGAIAGALWFILNMLFYNYPQPLKTRAGAQAKLPALLGWTLGWPCTLMDWSRKYAAEPVIAGCVLAWAATPSGQDALRLPIWFICTLAVFGLDIAFSNCGHNLREESWKGVLQLTALLIWLAWTLAYLNAHQVIEQAIFHGNAPAEGIWLGLWMVGLLPGGIIWLGAALARRLRRVPS